MRSSWMRAAVALLLSAVGAAPAAACDVCYGAASSGSPLISGARLGVFLLLGVTVAVLGGLLLVALKLAEILALPWYAYASVLVAGIGLFVSGVISPSTTHRPG